MRRLPPLNSLKAFEAAARLGGVVPAAEELCVSHGAISKQILNLERWLDVSLFDRSSNRLSLTTRGAYLLKEISGGLDRMSGAIDKVVAQKAEKTLVVSAPPTLTLHWLVPRLTEFLRLYPDIRLQLNNRRDQGNGIPVGVDVAICRGKLNDPQLIQTIFMNEAVTPMGSSQLAGFDKPNAIEMLRQQTWLMASMRPNDWQQWKAYAKVSDLQGIASLSFDHTYLALEAAIDGLGVAMGPRYLMQDEISSGRLQLLFPDIQAPSDPYYFVYHTRYSDDLAVLALKKWLQKIGLENESRVVDGANTRAK